MSNFKLQFGNDIRRKSGPADLTYDALKDIIINSYLKPEADFDYKFKLAYQDADDDWVSITNTEDVRLALAHHDGEALKIVVLGAQKIDLKAQAFKRAFETGAQLLGRGEAEAAIPHLVAALRVRKEPTAAYNLACAFSVLGRPADALLWLRTALDLGYHNFVWAVRDPDLANVRAAEEEQFVALVREMRARTLAPHFRHQQLACGPGGQCKPTAKTTSKTSPPPPVTTPSPTSSSPASPGPSRSSSPTPSEGQEPGQGQGQATQAETQTQTQTQTSKSYAEALGQLAAMGFVDAAANQLVLERHQGELAASLHDLLFA